MNNRVIVNGMRWGSVEPLASPVEYEEFVNTLVDALRREKENFRPEAAYAGSAMATKSAYSFFRSPDLNNPLEVKWALLLPPRSQETEAIAAALEPLVKHRQGQIIYSPTIIKSSPPDVWICDHYSQINEDVRPYYVLLAGSVQEIPFRFQYNLDVIAAVGRLAFEKIEDYAVYAKKVVDFETREKASVARHAVVFATEHAPNVDDGATFLSRHFMADPLVEMMQNQGFKVSYLAGEEVDREATLENLKATLGSRIDGLSPALVYTTTHGLGWPGKDEKMRRQMQGALVCQDYDGNSGVFSADLVPEAPFLHGSIVFTFACYGAGTPERSDFFHWQRDPRLLECRPTSDFVAALPTKMLAHPQGPLAFLGHIDPSWGYSFVGPQDNTDYKSWGSRMGPFREAVKLLLGGASIGYAVKGINATYAVMSVSLVGIEDQFRADPSNAEKTPWRGQLVNKWMTVNDMKNFVVLGDPAVKAKIKD